MAHRMKNRKPWSAAVLAVLLTVAIMASASITYAYLFADTKPVENVFVPATVDCEVLENYISNVKTDIRVKNTGTTEAYIRMAVVAVWQDDNGNYLSAAPVDGVDYTVAYNETDWFFRDGFWYSKEPVDVGSNTQVLIREMRPTGANVPEGYHLFVRFLASAIQSQPSTTVEEVWGVSVVDGKLT